MPPSDASAKSSSNPLLVLGKITSILDAFSLSRPVLSLGDIREHTGMPTSTVQRLVTNLTSQGFLDREEDAYRIGMRMAYWAAPATRGMEVVDILESAAQDAAGHHGRNNLFLQVRAALSRVRGHGGNPPCTAPRDAPGQSRTALRRLGRAGAAGLGSGTDGRRPPRSADTHHGIHHHHSEDLAVAVRQTRRDGFAITVGEREDGASGLSAPVFDSAASLVGAVTISGPTLRMPLETCEAWVEPLLTTAEHMTRLIGGRFPGEL